MDNNVLISQHIEVLKQLGSPSGLFLASASDVSTGYNKAWLRDNFYVSLGFEAVEDWETVQKLWRAILDILLKHEDKINWAAEHKPFQTWQYIHARYHPETFEEFWEEWGNRQNDAIGAILFKLGDLEEKGHGVIKTDADKKIVQKLVDYLASIEYWHDPDSGMWEEGEEIHASSVGACVAGLRKISKLPYISVQASLILSGEDTLKRLLPRESKNKFADLSLLSLIYPYDLVDREMQNKILNNIEYQFARLNGVIRYKNDRYYNKNEDGFSEEAEWTMGLAWLAIIYLKRGEIEKAKKYFDQTIRTITSDGKIPELYYSNSDKPNENIPLGWAESLFIVALKEFSKNN
jgi:phosphorylase kinase alpha/beta subunit